MVPIKIKRFTLSSILGILVAGVGMLLSSCAEFGSRKHFQVPDQLPLLQIVVPLDASFQTKTAPSGASQSAQLLVGLMVPVTEDGYCLTAAHNLGKGDAMKQFEYQIGQHQYGSSYTLVDAKENHRSPFIRMERGSNWIVTADKRGHLASHRFVSSEGGNRRVKMMLPELDPSQFQAFKNHSDQRDAVLCVRLREIKVWPEDDLALVKVPFATPSHFPLCGRQTAEGEPLMMLINPGLHQGTINHVTHRIAWPTDLDVPLKFATFNPMSLAGLEISEEGDSGGPVINREGELVGLLVASGKANLGRSLDLVVGIQQGPILDAIERSRKTSSGFSRAGIK
jgi:hypothetical protein